MKPLQKADSNLIISGVGPRLDLAPLFDRIFISSPDDGNEDSNMMDGILLPSTSQMTMKAYAVVEVLSTGPQVQWLKTGTRVLIVRAQASQVAHDGQRYWFTTENAVLGVVK